MFLDFTKKQSFLGGVLGLIIGCCYDLSYSPKEFIWLEDTGNTSNLDGQYQYAPNGATIIISSSELTFDIAYRNDATEKPGMYDLILIS